MIVFWKVVIGKNLWKRLRMIQLLNLYETWQTKVYEGITGMMIYSCKGVANDVALGVIGNIVVPKARRTNLIRLSHDKTGHWRYKR